MDANTLKVIADVYGRVCKAGVHRAPNIKTAEAAKVIENIQRDINIALFNELSLIFSRIGIETNDVIEAAGTKWNFHKYTPGLVGGHCIGVDPYYLVYKANQLGFNPQIITAGRKINNSMPHHVANETIKMLCKAGKKVSGARVLLMGLTFKENVNDTRNSKVVDIIRQLKDYGAEAIGCEPLVDNEIIKKEFNIENKTFGETKDLDAVIFVNAHRAFKDISVEELKSKFKDKPIIFQVKKFFNTEDLEQSGFMVKTL